MLDRFLSSPWEWLLLAVLVGVLAVVASWVVRNGGPIRTAFNGCLLVFVLGLGGFFASLAMDGMSDAGDSHGQVSVPGSGRLHLPAGEVTVTLVSTIPPEDIGGRGCPEVVVPENLELVVTAAAGLPQPSVTKDRSHNTFCDSETRQQVMSVHVPVAGDYIVTVKGEGNAATNPRLAFGSDSIFRFLLWPVFPIVIAVGIVGAVITYPRGPDYVAKYGPTETDVGLLESGQRVRGLLKSFTEAEIGPKRRGAPPPSRADMPDAPYYSLQVELLMPTLVRVNGRNRQQVPRDEVSQLAIGRELECAVDPSAPSSRFLVDWDRKFDDVP